MAWLQESLPHKQQNRYSCYFKHVNECAGKQRFAALQMGSRADRWLRYAQRAAPFFLSSMTSASTDAGGQIDNTIEQSAVTACSLYNKSTACTGSCHGTLGFYAAKNNAGFHNSEASWNFCSMLRLNTQAHNPPCHGFASL